MVKLLQTAFIFCSFVFLFKFFPKFQVLTQCSTWQHVTITWTNDDPVHWHINASPVLTGQIEFQQCTKITSFRNSNMVFSLMVQSGIYYAWIIHGDWLLPNTATWQGRSSKLLCKIHLSLKSIKAITVASYECHGISNQQTLVVCSTACSDLQQRKTQCSYDWAIMRGISWWLMYSPHKGTIIRKAFSCHAPLCYNSIIDVTVATPACLCFEFHHTDFQ